MSMNNTKKMNTIGLVALAWAVPGLGHFLAGRRFRGLVFFLTVGFLFWTGIILKANITLMGTAESFAMFKFIGAVASGVHFLLAALMGKGFEDPVLLKAELTNEMATTFLYVAGILNLLTMIDIWDICRGRKS